jgi:tRNA threonylcarbamoyladenosine biosynthesis protein TsaB
LNILAFDTCFAACSAAVGLGIGTEAARTISRFERMPVGHSERLPGMIEEIMTEAGLPYSALDRIGVTIGPGTFAGTRVGVAAARAFGLACGIPVVALTSLAVMARQVALAVPVQDHDICVAVDVRRAEVCVQWFDPAGLVSKGEPQVLSAHAAVQPGTGHDAVYAGSGADAVVKAAGLPGTSALFADLLPNAMDAIFLAYRVPLATSAISPLYLRAPDAKPPASALLQRI